jgi:hypothetical protein
MAIWPSNVHIEYKLDSGTTVLKKRNHMENRLENLAQLIGCGRKNSFVNGSCQLNVSEPDKSSRSKVEPLKGPLSKGLSNIFKLITNEDHLYLNAMLR